MGTFERLWSLTFLGSLRTSISRNVLALVEFWFLYNLKIARTSLDVRFLFAFDERCNSWSLCKLMYLLSLMLAVNAIIIKQHLGNMLFTWLKAADL